MPRPRPTAQRTDPAFSRGITVIKLRPQRKGEKDFDPDLEDETWCKVDESFADLTPLRFLVRDASQEWVVVGGVYVNAAVLVCNEEGPIHGDVGVSKKAALCVQALGGQDRNKRRCCLLSQVDDGNRSDCFIQFILSRGQYFAYYFSINGEQWSAIVTLAKIERNSGHRHERAHWVGEFEIKFERKDEDREEG